MKKIFLILAIVVLVFSLCSCAIEPEGEFYEAIDDNTAMFTRFNGTSKQKECKVKEKDDEGRTVVKIGQFAFSSQENLEVVNLPKTITEIDPWAFTYVPKLKEINVDPENEYFSSDEGVLYNKDKTTVVAYPNGKGLVAKEITFVPYTVLSTVTTIGENAFYRCSGLSEVILPAGLLKICDRAFQRTEQLAPPVLPDSLTYIGIDAFSYFRTSEDDAFKARNVSKTIYIPSSVTYIGDYAFFGSGLNTVNMGAAAVSGMTLGTKWLPNQSGAQIKPNWGMGR